MVLADIVMLVRILIAFFSLIVVPMSFMGFLRFSRRDGQSIANALRSVAFMVSLSSGSFQWTFLVDAQPVVSASPRILLSLVLILATLIVCLFLLVRLWQRTGMDMARVEENIDVALAITDLALLSPEDAQAYARECRRRTAEIMIERGRTGHGS